MGYLNYNLEKIAGIVGAAAKLAGPSASKIGLIQQLKSVAAAPKVSLPRKLGAKAVSWLKSKIKPQPKSIELSSNDASWLDDAALRDRLGAANKFKISL
jgi:hypothetical protein